MIHTKPGRIIIANGTTAKDAKLETAKPTSSKNAAKIEKVNGY